MLLTLHAGLANASTIFALLLTLLAFWRYARGQGVDGGFLGALVIGEGLMIVQGVVGGLLLAEGARVARTGIHVLYGLVAVISFPAFYAFLQGRDGRREMLLWALLCLFVFGITLRATQVVG